MMRRILAVVMVWINLSLPACGAEVDEVAELPIKYVGNAYSQKFHRPSCAFAQVMWRRRRLNFHFRHEATDMGFRPCCWCLPKRWKRLEGHILVDHPPAEDWLQVAPNGSSTN